MKEGGKNKAVGSCNYFGIGELGDWEIYSN
jgi:hypothetical protein